MPYNEYRAICETIVNWTFLSLHLANDAMRLLLWLVVLLVVVPKSIARSTGHVPMIP